MIIFKIVFCVNFMNALMEFIYKNNLYIVGVIVIFVAIIVVFSMFGVDLSGKKSDAKVVQTVVMETMRNQDANADAEVEDLSVDPNAETEDVGLRMPPKNYSNIFLDSNNDTGDDTADCPPCNQRNGRSLNNEYDEEDDEVDNPMFGRRRRGGNIPRDIKPNPMIDMMAEKEFKKLDLDPTTSFCEQQTNGIKLQQECSMLTGTKCGETSCCVWANGKCAAGNSSGTIFKTDKFGEPINVDTYYYQNKCYGPSCSSDSSSSSSMTLFSI